MPRTPADAFTVAPADGLAVDNPNGVISFKATAGATGGALTAVVATTTPGQGPPLHVHPGQDEIILTLEGRYRVRLGDEVGEAPPGAFVFIPRGTPHTWQNVGDGPARFFAALMPAGAGFERFFPRFAGLPAGERDGAAFARLAGEMGAMEVVGPPLAESHPV